MLIMFSLFFDPVAWASDISVTPDDDINAAYQVLTPGDTMTFTPGEYEVTGWNWELLGEEGSPITVEAQSGAVFVITSNEGDYPGYGIRLTNSSWVILKNIDIAGDDGWEETEEDFIGIQINGGSDITLNGLRIANTTGTLLSVGSEAQRVSILESEVGPSRDGHGISIGCWNASCFATDYVVHNNLIHDIKDGIGLFLLDGTQGATVTDNVIYNVESEGIWAGNSANGAGNIIESNAIWNTGLTGMIIRGPTIARNNIIFSTGDYGAYIYNPNNFDFTDIVFSFNTIVNSENWAVRINDWNESTGHVFANNAICNPVSNALTMEFGDNEETASQHFIQGNVVTGRVENLSAEQGHFQPGYGYADFTDVELWNFYPANGSMLKSNGVADAQAYVPEHDFNDNSRSGEAPDVGAYEWNGANNPGWPIQENFKVTDYSQDVEDNYVGGGCCSDSGSEKGALLLIPLLGLGLVRRRR